MVSMTATLDAPKGLEGVVAAETTVGSVRGIEGFYHYRQYSAVELARTASFEDVWFLLLYGYLPDRSEAARFATQVDETSVMPDDLISMLPAIARCHGGCGLDALRSAISLAGGSLGLRPWLDLEPDELRHDVLRVSCLVPLLAAGLRRCSVGECPIAPVPGAGFAANYLYMLTGTLPRPEHARAVEKYLISTMDHGLNASTFTARVVTSTGADVAAAVTAAAGALSGPLHGGAPSRALDSLDAIGAVDRAEEWLRDTVSSGGRLMGFGHRIYRTEDPRAALLRDVAEELGGPLVELATEVERIAVRVLAELKPGRDLYTNVELYAGVVMELCGIPREMFTPTFAVSRTIGWCAHILEQAADNRIIRPTSRYVGPDAPQPLPATWAR
jgi:citrate synthase